MVYSNSFGVQSEHILHRLAGKFMNWNTKCLLEVKKTKLFWVEKAQNLVACWTMKKCGLESEKMLYGRFRTLLTHAQKTCQEINEPLTTAKLPSFPTSKKGQRRNYVELIPGWMQYDDDLRHVQNEPIIGKGIRFLLFFQYHAVSTFCWIQARFLLSFVRNILRFQNWPDTETDSLVDVTKVKFFNLFIYSFWSMHLKCHCRFVNSSFWHF